MKPQLSSGGTIHTLQYSPPRMSFINACSVLPAWRKSGHWIVTGTRELMVTESAGLTR